MKIAASNSLASPIVPTGSESHRSSGNEFDRKLHEVAALYEKEFVRHMLHKIRNPQVNGALIPQSQGEKIFEEELFNYYADLMAERGGGSLREQIYQNLKTRYGNMRNR